MSIDESLSYQQTCACRLDGCAKTGCQCVDVSLPVEVSPVACVGEIVTTCQGTPVVTCRTDPCCNTAVLTVTQQLCLTIPVRFGANTCVGEATIACAAGGCGCQ